MQSFCSVIISYMFVMLHMRIWPYPQVTDDLFKLFADIQIFLVLLVGLVLRFDPSTLNAEGYSREFYQTVLFVLLTSTEVPLMARRCTKMTCRKRSCCSFRSRARASTASAR